MKTMPTLDSIRISDPLLFEKIKAGRAAGFFSDIDDFIKESVNTFLASRSDVRTGIACELYKKGKISLGKATEMAGLNIEEMKKTLAGKGIKRGLPLLKDEERMADEIANIKKEN